MFIIRVRLVITCAVEMRSKRTEPLPPPLAHPPPCVCLGAVENRTTLTGRNELSNREILFHMTSVRVKYNTSALRVRFYHNGPPFAQMTRHGGDRDRDLRRLGDVFVWLIKLRVRFEKFRLLLVDDSLVLGSLQCVKNRIINQHHFVRPG